MSDSKQPRFLNLSKELAGTTNAMFRDWISDEEHYVPARACSEVVYAEGRRAEPKVQAYRPNYAATAPEMIVRYNR